MPASDKPHGQLVPSTASTHTASTRTNTTNTGHELAPGRMATYLLQQSDGHVCQCGSVLILNAEGSKYLLNLKYRVWV